MATNQHPFDALIEHIAAAIAQRLGTQGPRAQAKAKAAPKRKRNMSPEGIARIRAAAKKRWAKYRKEKAAATK
jgi:hypothetical protein